jgi:pimeloyl-ACP methyl ester carboxylesterase
MARESALDEKTERKFYLDCPDDVRGGEDLTVLLNLHGGGSAGVWQRDYFPAYELADAYRLVVAAPTAATTEPTRHWAAAADDEHLINISEMVFERFGLASIASFWLVGHSQGGGTCNRLLSMEYFAARVDGWLSLSGGRIGPAERAANFGPPRSDADRAAMEAFFARRRALGPPPPPTADISFIYATGEHEIAALPDTSPWADKFGAGPRVRLPDVVDDQPGKVYDGRWEGNSTPSWGRLARPGTAQIYVYPNARDGRVIADVIRLDKGHTEGLEPKVTEELIKLIVSAPGGKARAAAVPERQALTQRVTRAVVSGPANRS